MFANEFVCVTCVAGVNICGCDEPRGGDGNGAEVELGVGGHGGHNVVEKGGGSNAVRGLRVPLRAVFSSLRSAILRRFLLVSASFTVAFTSRRFRS